MKCQFKLLRMAVALICSKYHTVLGTRAASPVLFVLVIILHADSEGFDFAAVLVGTCSWTFWQQEQHCSPLQILAFNTSLCKQGFVISQHL